jgi:2Fe-2S ferredoxin
VDAIDHIPQSDAAAAGRALIYGGSALPGNRALMPRVIYIEPDGERHPAEVERGWSLMQGAMDEGVAGIEAQCGGMCACATCHCYVEDGWLARLPPPSADEATMLLNVAARRLPNSRLSCQIRVEPALDGIVVRFPDRQS